jgi:hypothetical protein
MYKEHDERKAEEDPGNYTDACTDPAGKTEAEV